MKKISSLLLSFIMLVSLTLGMGISVFAAVSETDNGIRYVENDDNTVKIVDYAGTNENVIIPNTISGKKVTRIANNAFFNNSTVKTLSIPASVTEIDDMVFYNCSNLTTIKVAADNKNYDSRNNCNAIIETATGTLIAGCKTTKVPNGVAKISAHAFDGCSGLTAITLPESIKVIQHKSFASCDNLKDITFLNKNCKICDTCKAGDKTCDLTISKSATIHGYKGSTAEKYAKEYGRKFVALSDTTKLSTPTLKGTVNANGSFTLSWNKISGATKYGIYYKNANGQYTWVTTVTGTSWTTGTAQYGRTYTYKVLAVGNTSSIVSDYSNTVNVTNNKKLQSPTLKGTVNANGSFTLSWNAISGATKYGIYYKNANGTYTWVKTVTGTSWTTGTAQYG
ncbi:MAG: leucine-rich repeat domain-containing protein, partial [Eubacterium sp.]|nr:leucine-rich repeat domain-containing protein [Eubacterium sp.]